MSKISYDALAVVGLKDVLIQISETCNELNIDFFIVGAVARNIWYASHNKSPTGTQDVDFGIYVPTEKKYNALRNVLKKKYNYTASTENAFCMFTPTGIQIDLLPFGKIEENSKVLIEGKGLTKINLDGFEDAYNLGIKEVAIGKEVYKTCSVAGIVILKMIAFDDRPEHRVKDIMDISSICNHYPDIETNLIWNDHSDLYEDNREHAEVAMIVLGREMRAIIAKKTKLQNRIINILDKAINQKSTFMLHMIEDPVEETLTSKANLLRHIKQGLVGNK